MPFTPIHMGPAAALKLVGAGYFSFTVFGYSQILIDLEPLVRLSRGDAVVHGYSHTYLGAIVIGILACISGKPICEGGLRWWNRLFRLSFLQLPTRIAWSVAAVSAFLGTFSHIVLDSVMHADMHPLSPLSERNGLLHIISVGQLHLLCLGLGGLGAAGLLVMWFWRKWTYVVDE